MSSRVVFAMFLLVSSTVWAQAAGQSAPSGQIGYKSAADAEQKKTLLLRDFHPVSMLHVPTHAGAWVVRRREPVQQRAVEGRTRAPVGSAKPTVVMAVRAVTNRPTVTVILPTLNERHWIVDCLGYTTTGTMITATLTASTSGLSCTGPMVVNVGKTQYSNPDEKCS